MTTLVVIQNSRALQVLVNRQANFRVVPVRKALLPHQ